MTILSTNSGEVGRLVGRNFRTLGVGPSFTDIAARKGQLLGITFGSLYRINRSSGNATFVGNLGVGDMNGLTFGPKGKLYGTGGTGFYRINIKTGRAKRVASIPNFLSSGDITYDSKNGRFLATSNSSFGSDRLLAITPKGRADIIGNIGFRDVFGLTFKGKRLLGYTARGQEIRINLKTGAGKARQQINLFGNEIWGAT
ncbi:hypothetical protein C7B76_00965 [filamentous cyanobacterium CCP2]|nr:hypothetical protein C7B76_00965 [filamentous cyanobacterium CCP2]